MNASSELKKDKKVDSSIISTSKVSQQLDFIDARSSPDVKNAGKALARVPGK